MFCATLYAPLKIFYKNVKECFLKYQYKIYFMSGYFILMFEKHEFSQNFCLESFLLIVSITFRKTCVYFPKKCKY